MLVFGVLIAFYVSKNYSIFLRFSEYSPYIPDHDILDVPDIEFESLSRRATSQFRRRVPVALCTIQKDGEAYVDEWVNYNLALGFSKIFIYDNSFESIEGIAQDKVSCHLAF